MTTAIAFIILLGVLITIHEYGHFIAARSVGIRVERFSIGIPPRFFTVKSVDDGFLVNIYFFKFIEGHLAWSPIIQKTISSTGRIGSGTEYVIALLPLGGYVKMAGIIDENMDLKIEYKNDEFMSKPLWAKIWVLSAGVIMNTILAFFIFSAIGFFQGSPEINNDSLISEVVPNNPADLAGLISGDRIIKIDDSSIDSWEDLTNYIKARPNTELNLVIERGREKFNLDIITTTRIDGLDSIGVIGIYPEILYADMTFGEALGTGWSRTKDSFGMILISLKMLGSGEASVKDFGGPIMIAQLAGQTAEAGLIPFLTFMALLSVNLAFLNILPIPVLDGGHILIHLIEALINRPLNLKARIIIQQIGMAFILILMVTIIFQDISRLFN